MGSTSTSTASPVRDIDVRQLAPSERHSTIFGSFDELQPGQALQILNDHDPQPLHRQLDSRSPGQFQWAYLEQGPTQWRVLVSKLEKPEPSGSCCGACGG